MSNLDHRPPPPLREADYEAIEAAVMETEKGRWFLAEYTRRNRSSDTHAVLDAIAGIERLMKRERRPDADRIRLDIGEMKDAIERTKREIAQVKTDGAEDSRFAKASNELDAIVNHTEEATSEILATAEKIQEIAFTLREAGIEPEICDAIEMLTTTIFMACSFQDLTGQRTQKVVHVLRYLETRIDAMIGIWGLEEGELRNASGATPDGVKAMDIRPDSHLLNGPATDGLGMNQSRVDDMIFDQIDEMSFDQIEDRGDLGFDRTEDDGDVAFDRIEDNGDLTFDRIEDTGDLAFDRIEGVVADDAADGEDGGDEIVFSPADATAVAENDEGPTGDPLFEDVDDDDGFDRIETTMAAGEADGFDAADRVAADIDFAAEPVEEHDVTAGEVAEVGMDLGATMTDEDAAFADLADFDDPASADSDSFVAEAIEPVAEPLADETEPVDGAADAEEPLARAAEAMEAAIETLREVSGRESGGRGRKGKAAAAEDDPFERLSRAERQALLS